MNTVKDKDGNLIWAPSKSIKRKTRPECLLDAPVCGETAKRFDKGDKFTLTILSLLKLCYPFKAGRRIIRTFANQCRFDEYNGEYGECNFDSFTFCFSLNTNSKAIHFIN